MYSPLWWNTSIFNRKLSSSGARRWIIIKEGGSKEEDRQEGTDVNKCWECIHRLKTTLSKWWRWGGARSAHIIINKCTHARMHTHAHTHTHTHTHTHACTHTHAPIQAAEQQHVVQKATRSLNIFHCLPGDLVPSLDDVRPYSEDLHQE